MFWSVAITKSNREITAQDNLHRQGYTTYLPKFLHKQGNITKIKVLFPRYIFILIEHQWYSINSTLGISRLLLTNDNKPAVVPDTVIEELRSREAKGLISLPSQGRFNQGENVRLADGPFAGYIGIHAGMRDADRARVLIELLGRSTLVEVDEGTLQAVAVGIVK